MTKPPCKDLISRCSHIPYRRVSLCLMFLIDPSISLALTLAMAQLAGLYQLVASRATASKSSPTIP